MGRSYNNQPTTGVYLSEMKTDLIIHHLETNRLVFKYLLEGKDHTEYTWRPRSGAWTLLEIVCHLYDEEREDFRTRVKNTLETPQIQPPAIDPPGWVKSRKYAAQSYDEKLATFMAERKKSIRWLKSLENPKWKNIYQHKYEGPMTACDLLANWLAHDYHHIRQINRNCYEYLRHAGKTRLTYAGNW